MKKNQNKRFEVAERLEGEILSGRLPPGAPLPEMRLAQELGVSQASIREALQELEAKGLVVKFPNRGSVVIRLTLADLLHIYEVRRELEPLACGLAAQRLTEDLVASLPGCLDRMDMAASDHDFPAFSRADLDLHRAIWQAQPNRYLERSLQSVCLPLFAYDLIRRHATGYLDAGRVVRQHRLLVQAILTGDPNQASRVMRRLITRWQRQDVDDYAQLFVNK